jgi:hypothetical protein
MELEDRKKIQENIAAFREHRYQQEQERLALENAKIQA